MKLAHLAEDLLEALRDLDLVTRAHPPPSEAEVNDLYERRELDPNTEWSIAVFAVRDSARPHRQVVGVLAMSTFTEHEVQPISDERRCLRCGVRAGRTVMESMAGDGMCMDIERCFQRVRERQCDALRTALISSVETDADVVQALRLWGAQLEMNATCKGAAEQSRLMLELADRVQARIEAARKALEGAR